MDAFSNSNTRDTSQQEGIGIQAVGTTQFFLQSLIVFRRQRPGEILGTNRKVFADDQARLEAMALGGQVIEQTAKTEQELLTRMVAYRRTQVAKPAEPASMWGSRRSWESRRTSGKVARR